MSEMVLRPGRVFRFGDHVDGKGRAFSLTRAEFEAANPEGTEVPIGFDPYTRGHSFKDSAFDGRLGSASNFVANGPYLDADFVLNPLLNEVIDDENLTMSAIFGIEAKELRRIDVTDRRKSVIREAAFFAGDDADEVALFADMALFPGETAAREALGTIGARQGLAGPGDRPDDPEGPLSGEELAQHMHEVIASGFPGLCDPAHMATAAFCRGDKSPSHLIAMHDLCLHHGAKCPGSSHAQFAQEEYPVAEEFEDQDPSTPTPDQTALFARLEALEAENARIKADNARIRAARVAAEAAGFAREHAHVLLPKAQALGVGLYRALAGDDDAGGDDVVSFAYGKDDAQKFQGSRVALLREFVATLTPHGMGTEKTTNGRVSPPPPRDGFVVFSHDEDPSVLSDARKAELDRLNAANQ